MILDSDSRHLRITVKVSQLPSSAQSIDFFFTSPTPLLLYIVYFHGTALASPHDERPHLPTPYASNPLMRAVMPMQWLPARLRASKAGTGFTAQWMFIVLLASWVSLVSAMKESLIAELRKEAHDMFRYAQPSPQPHLESVQWGVSRN